jgi:hypothetical protein
MTHTTCFVCLIGTVSGHCKNTFEEQALVAGKYQNLNNLLLDIYASSR